MAIQTDCNYRWDGVKVSVLLEKESPEVDVELKGEPLDQPSTVQLTVDVTNVNCNRKSLFRYE